MSRRTTKTSQQIAEEATAAPPDAEPAEEIDAGQAMRAISAISRLMESAGAKPSAADLTPAAHWKRLAHGTAYVRLPSQVVVLARKINLGTEIAAGRLASNPTVSTPESGLDYARDICCVSLISPKAVRRAAETDPLPEGAIDIAWMSEVDIAVLQNWAMSVPGSEKVGVEWVD